MKTIFNIFFFFSSIITLYAQGKITDDSIYKVANESIYKIANEDSFSPNYMQYIYTKVFSISEYSINKIIYSDNYKFGNITISDITHFKQQINNYKNTKFKWQNKFIISSKFKVNRFKNHLRRKWYLHHYSMPLFSISGNIVIFGYYYAGGESLFIYKKENNTWKYLETVVVSLGSPE